MLSTMRKLSDVELNYVAGGPDDGNTGSGVNSNGLTSNQQNGCEILGGIVGGALGLISGGAMTAVSGPITGAIVGLGIGAAGVTSATNGCEQVVRDMNGDSGSGSSSTGTNDPWDPNNPNPDPKDPPKPNTNGT